MHGSKIKYSRATIAIQEGVDHMVAGVGISDRLESDQPYIWYVSARYRSLVSVPGQAVFRRSADSTVPPRGGRTGTSPCTAPVPGRPVSLSRFADGLSFRPKSSSVSIVGFAGAVRERTPPPLGRGPRRTELETRHARLSRGRARATSSIRNNAHKRNRKSPAAVRVTTSAVPWSQGVRQVLRLRAVCCSA